MALSVTDLLIRKLVTILENEGTTITGVRDEVDKIKGELQSMKAFLVDAETNKTITEGEKLWVANIRDLAYDVEDIIDEFMYHMNEKESGSRLSRRLHKSIRLPKRVYHRRKTAKSLHEITEKLQTIPEKNQRYGVGLVGGATTSEDIHKLVLKQAESSFFVMEDELVGIEGNKQVLMRWLLDEEKHQTVISVVGMGGSGKTTLAAKIFTNEGVKKHFDCCAWITVSQTYADLFRSLIMEFHKSMKEAIPANLNAMSSRELKEILINYVEFKRYLVVLDDVWDIEVWREIKVALQDRQLGSRIVLTTRKEEVTSHTFGVRRHVYRIQPLQKNEAWELFSKKAFSTDEHKTCPPELKSLACQLVEKCEGLPLAIVALGGLMSSKESQDQWQQVFNSFNWHLQKDPLLNPVKNILMLSFNDLPSPLKHCFLYCSLFPEDFEIKRKRLIRLWIAEGFVEDVKGITPEEVADGYLMELCFRSMLQVVKRNESGRPKKVKMHDLMRELALSTAEKEKFGHVHDGVMKETSARRLAIHKMGEDFKPWPGMSKIRSLLVFDTDMSSSSFSNALLSQFKVLRTLDMEGVEIDELPDAVVSLFNLRYLNLRGTLIKKLPESIGRLRNLLFLNIKDTKIESLPQGIGKLLNLRHLPMYSYYSRTVGFKHWRGKRAPSSISKLRKLQCLLGIEAEGDIVRHIGNMSQLTAIGITNVKEIYETDLWISIKKLTLLHNLVLMASREEVILPVKAECPPLPHLRRLSLVGKLRNVKPWLSSLHSLTTLVLHWSRLEEDILPQIEALPNLTWLELGNACVVEELFFSRGFVKLVTLYLWKFESVTKITIAKGVMPNLRNFWVHSFTRLKKVPMGLEYLSNLRSKLPEIWVEKDPKEGEKMEIH